MKFEFFLLKCQLNDVIHGIQMWGAGRLFKCREKSWKLMKISENFVVKVKSCNREMVAREVNPDAVLFLVEFPLSIHCDQENISLFSTSSISSLVIPVLANIPV